MNQPIQFLDLLDDHLLRQGNTPPYGVSPDLHSPQRFRPVIIVEAKPHIIRRVNPFLPQNLLKEHLLLVRGILKRQSQKLHPLI